MLDLLKFSITADNRTAAAFGKLKGDLRGVKGMLAGVDDYARRAGKAMRNIGLGVSAAITAPLALVGRQSLQLFDQQAKGQASVTAAVLSTGGAAGKSADELFRMAAGIQKITTFGDEDILKSVTTPLLTFTNLAGPALERAQMAVLNISTAMGTDLRSNAVQVGKALNDPVKGLDGLSRAGIQFSDDQKEVIKALVATGDMAGAQAAILNELETQFGGQAEAAAKVGMGPLKQLGNAINDLKEELGGQMVTFLPEVLKSVRSAVAWFGKLSPEVKRNIVLFGGIAAAVGPVLLLLGTFTLGISTLTTALGAMGAVLLANPILAVIAAVAGGAYLIYRNWDGISAWFAAKWEMIKEGVATGWEGIKTLFLDYTPAGLIYKNWDGIADWFTSRWAAVETAFAIGWSGIRGMLSGQYSPTKLIYDLWTGIGDWFTALGPELTAAFGTLWEAIKTEVSSWPGRMIQTGKDMIAALFLGMSSEEAGSEIGYGIGRDVSAGLVTGLLAGKQDIGAASQEITDYLEGKTKAGLGIQSPSRVFREIGGNVTEGLALGLADNSGRVLEEMQGVTDGLIKVGQQAPDIDRMFGTTFSGIIRGADNARDALGRLLDRLADQALGNLFSSLFGNIGLGKVLGGLLGFQSGGVFGGGRQVAFANGGVVSSPTMFPMAGGSTGLMGEAGPEAIMPLSRGSDGRLGVRLQGGSGGSVNAPVTFNIDARGADAGAVTRIEMALDRAQAEFPSRVVQAVIRAQKSRILT